MSNQNPLGELAKDDAVRDAVHVAIMPVQAVEDLLPGHSVTMSKTGLAYKVSHGEGAGIVDPFLSGCVHCGEWFYLCLYPNTVTGMVHHWAHPDFDNETPEIPGHSEEMKKAKEWLTYAAAHIEDYSGVCTFDRLMQKARDEWVGEDYATAGYDCAMDFMNENHVEFWRNYDIYTGGADAGGTRATSFGCSC